MITGIIVVLFVLQLLSFYFIIILNTKLGKFKDLEKKQERLMREMDDTVGAYLSEIIDENNRLIQELGNVKVPEYNPTKEAEEIIDHNETQVVQSNVKQKMQSKADFDIEQRVLTPKNLVANAYSKQMISKQPTPQIENEQEKTIDENASVVVKMEDSKVPTIEEQVIQLAKQGESAETIARKLQKGKTEIELLLKFHT